VGLAAQRHYAVTTAAGTHEDLGLVVEHAG
jgi:hypothetical protein